MASTAPAAQTRQALQQQVNEIAAGVGFDPETGEVAPPPTSTPFGTWLLAQHKREDHIGMLAQGAKRDPRFPVEGDPEAVRKRLREVQAEGDMFEAVDDAELDWLSV